MYFVKHYNKGGREIDTYQDVDSPVLQYQGIDKLISSSTVLPLQYASVYSTINQIILTNFPLNFTQLVVQEEGPISNQQIFYSGQINYFSNRFNLTIIL